VEIILSTYRKKLKTDKEIPWIGGLHPATRVFQALRMCVNDELGVIERVLPQAIDVMGSGGRLAVITFHSLEDRIVKHYLKKLANKTIRIINKKPIIPKEEELRENPRARSAKLRVVEKI
jgi:16S rRNA (cytosine1402-N4)-methyltransferase